MSNATPNLALPYILSAQAQKHVTHNEALRALDALIQLSVGSRSLNVPPAEPQEGSRHIVADSPTGEWSGQGGKVAAFQDGVWSFFPPQTGWQAWVEDEASFVVYRSGAWIDPQPVTGFGAYTRLRTVQEDLLLDGPVKTAATQIPNRAIVLGVSVRVDIEITGATSFDVGVMGEPSRFGGSLGVTSGQTNIGVIGPSAFYADTPIQVTANGSDFTGGSVHLVLHFIECGPAVS